MAGTERTDDYTGDGSSEKTVIGASAEHQKFLEKMGSTPLKTAASLAELMCRPELSYEMLAEIDQNRKLLPAEVIEQVEIEIKYEGYIERQKRQVDQYKKMEKHKIPNWMDYDEVPSLRLEARQKLKAFRPVSVGQASRISGVSRQIFPCFWYIWSMKVICAI